MDQAKLIPALAGAVLLLLGVGWMLLRGFVSELKETRDRISRSADGWDETCDLAAKLDRAAALLEPRVARVEAHDFQKLNGDLQGFSLRLGRVETDVNNLTSKLADVHGMTHDTNEMVKVLMERRRVEREAS